MEWRDIEGGCEIFEVKDIWAGKLECFNCGEICDHYLYRKTLRLYFFLFTLGEDTKETYIKCSRCGYRRDWNRKKYNEVKKRQEKKLFSGRFPDYVVKRNYMSDQMELPKKILAFVLALIFLAIFIGVYIYILQKSDDAASMIGFSVFYLIITVIPSLILFSASKDLIAVLRFLSIYKKTCNK